MKNAKPTINYNDKPLKLAELTWKQLRADLEINKIEHKKNELLGYG